MVKHKRYNYYTLQTMYYTQEDNALFLSKETPAV